LDFALQANTFTRYWALSHQQFKVLCTEMKAHHNIIFYRTNVNDLNIKIQETSMTTSLTAQAYDT